jgi:hypothetical protein
VSALPDSVERRQAEALAHGLLDIMQLARKTPDGIRITQEWLVQECARVAENALLKSGILAPGGRAVTSKGEQT